MIPDNDLKPRDNTLKYTLNDYTAKLRISYTAKSAAYTAVSTRALVDPVV